LKGTRKLNVNRPSEYPAEETVSVNQVYLPHVDSQNVEQSSIFGKIDVEGQGFTWRLHPIDNSEEIVPSKYLERLTILKYNDINRDAMYVGVPIGEQKPKLSQIVKGDVNTALVLLNDVMSNGMMGYNGNSAAANSIQLPDPLLICGFGTSPLFLVQIGKWL